MEQMLLFIFVAKALSVAPPHIISTQPQPYCKCTAPFPSSPLVKRVISREGSINDPTTPCDSGEEGVLSSCSGPSGVEYHSPVDAVGHRAGVSLERRTI